jgi:hypothetical protein
MRRQVALWLIGSSVVVAAAFVIVATLRDLSSLENVLLQIFSLGLGLAGSYTLGQESAREGARDLMKPHARSAFRRLISLYRGLSRVAAEIATSRETMTREQFAISSLDRLDGIVTEQIATAADALEDWGDIVPDDVAELRAKLLALKNGQSDE